MGPGSAAAWCTLFKHALCGATDRCPQRDRFGAELQRNYQTPRNLANHVYNHCRAASAGYRSGPALTPRCGRPLRLARGRTGSHSAAAGTGCKRCIPFDLESGPLLDARLLRLREQEHILLLTVHHIISDGWSRDVLLHELGELYEAFCRDKPLPLLDLPIQYADYVHWQRQWLHSEAGEAQLAYWTQQLREPLPILELPTDRPRTGELSLRTARQSFQLPEELCAALTRFSRQEGTTLFMTLITAFKTLLYSYTGQEDIRVGTLVANRQHQETEGLIGLFANLVILRTNLGGNPTLRQVLQRVRTTTLEAHAYQELPFEYLARTLARERHLGRLSLFQTMFTMQHALPQFPRLPEVTCDVLKTEAIDATPCELVLSLHGGPHGLEGLCLYKTALYEEATIVRMLRDFQQLLACFSAQPQQPVSTLLS